jgi:hypothetical protein
MVRLRKFMNLRSDGKSLLIKGCHKSNLRIGAAIGDADRLEAHAWLESNGRVLIGGSGSIAIQCFLF